MLDLILTIGLPASGKTTWVNDKIKQNPKYYNLNRDDLRLMIQGRDRYNKFTKVRERIVTDLQFSGAKSALLSGMNVIISDTNLNPATKNKWEYFVKSFNKEHNTNIKYSEKMFTDVPLGVCLERDKLREHPVGSKVIMGMFEKYQTIYWPKPEIDPSLPNAYIVDVDGTIATMNNRHPYQWDKVSDDLPKKDVISIINTLKHAGNKIIICSGRDGIAKDDTLDWLKKYNVEFNHFYIRPEGDSRKDYDIKEEIYNTHIKGKFNVKGVFDDRDQVIHLWRHLGLTTFQCNYGEF